MAYVVCHTRVVAVPGAGPPVVADQTVGLRVPPWRRRTVMAATAESPRGWWTISGDALMDMLHRVANGEDPSHVYADEESKCKREDYRDHA
jgi:hypothetical protein